MRRSEVYIRDRATAAELTRRLAEVCLASDLTITVLARKHLHCDRQTLYDWIGGKKRPCVYNFAKIRRFLATMEVASLAHRPGLFQSARSSVVGGTDGGRNRQVYMGRTKTIVDH